MPSTKKTCAYIKCDLGDNNERKEFYGTESAMYCCPKHGTYQRRLKDQDAVIEDGEVSFKKVLQEKK